MIIKLVVQVAYTMTDNGDVHFRADTVDDQELIDHKLFNHGPDLT